MPFGNLPPPLCSSFAVVARILGIWGRNALKRRGLGAWAPVLVVGLDEGADLLRRFAFLGPFGHIGGLSYADVAPGGMGVEGAIGLEVAVVEAGVALGGPAPAVA